MRNRSHRILSSVQLLWQGQAWFVIVSIFTFTLFAFAPLDNTAWAERGAEPQTYVLNTSTGEPYANDAGTGFQDLVVAEAFKRIGLKGRVERYVASARALINANEGIDQGVAMRVMGLDKKYPNLVRVDERLIENDFVAYSRDLNFSTDSWQSLEPYVVALINGWVIFERNLSPTQSKTAVTEPDQMFAMLAKKRVDVVLYERWQGLYRARLSGLDVRIHEPPLASVNMYMYVHQDYAHLAPKLAQALRDMKADGTYQAIFDKALTPLMQKMDGH
ncbi:substrate-binding periplasmic protein [Magnetovibrio blakemorei]|uniref:substrate-binding periplasmic protein n=1 Tax=Magnetovibrio blakemorei TaxID=28181 RepID=UPI00147C4472|nr:transporter substrate-binding domain-containing protein [Magnetovibrio blakemorei]